MKTRLIFIVLAATGISVLSLLPACTKDKTPRPVSTACDPNKIYFEKSVKPILNSNCAMSGCHDAATRQDGVNLSTWEGVRAQVKPGRPGDSEIIKMVNESDPEDRMPPPPSAPLTQEQKDLIWNWIAQGADNETCTDDTSGCNPVNVSFAGDIRPILTSNCLGCHSGSKLSGGVSLGDHGGVQAAAQSGKLYNAVSQNGQATPMPQNGKLAACDIKKIKVWIDEGMKNN